MFTQCPECGSVFRVTADALKVAAGLVRCGVCQHRFDALAALTDDPGAPVIEDGVAADDGTPADDDAAPPLEDTITVEELGAGEVIELGAADDDNDVDADAGDEHLSTPAGDDRSTTSDTDLRDAAAEWLPESGAPLARDEPDRTGSVEDLDSPDSIEVNDSSVTGLEAIILGGDEPPTAATTDDLEFHGSEADLERVFIATGAPVAAAAPEDTVTPEPDETPDPNGIAYLLPELLEVRDLPELAGDEARDAAAESAAPIGTATTAAQTAPAGRPDLDRTDEFPILVLDERDEVLANLGGADDRALDDADTTRANDDPHAPQDEERERAEHGEGDRVRGDEEHEGVRDSVSSTAVGTAGATAIPAALWRNMRAPDDMAADDSPGPRLAIPEHLRRGDATADDDDAADLRFGLDDETPRWWERRATWVAGIIVLALALCAQAVHYNREPLSRNATLGPWVLRIYTLIGVQAPIPSDLGAMELHQWGAATDARAAGRLRLRASLVNRAPFAQPYPVLRVTLHDRFGNVLGSRDVGARDYLPGGAPQRRLLTTGQRLDAEIVVVDPGTDAVGYEIDLCEERRDGVRCQGATRAPS